jgi:hypothetical protein
MIYFFNLYLKDEVTDKVPKHPTTLIEHSQEKYRTSKHHTS